MAESEQAARDRDTPRLGVLRWVVRTLGANRSQSSRSVGWGMSAVANFHRRHRSLHCHLSHRRYLNRIGHSVSMAAHCGSVSGLLARHGSGLLSMVIWF